VPGGRHLLHVFKYKYQSKIYLWKIYNAQTQDAPPSNGHGRRLLGLHVF
jgi:hypothetical protein